MSACGGLMNDNTTYKLTMKRRSVGKDGRVVRCRGRCSVLRSGSSGRLLNWGGGLVWIKAARQGYYGDILAAMADRVVHQPVDCTNEQAMTESTLTARITRASSSNRWCSCSSDAAECLKSTICSFDTSILRYSL